MSRHRSSLSTSSLLASPSREKPSLHTSGLLSELFDSRNSELSHRDALEQAKAEHDRVRERALRVFEMHKLEVERQRIVKEQKEEEERLKREAALMAEKQRLEALKAAKAPAPPPLPKPESVKAPEPKPENKASVIKAAEPAKPVVPAVTETKAPAVTTTELPKLALGEKTVTPVTTTAEPEKKKSIFGAPLKSIPAAPSGFGTPSFGSAATPAAASKASGGIFGKAPAASPFAPKPAASLLTPVAPVAPASTAEAVVEANPTYFPYNQRYVEIHKKLKELRKAVEGAASQAGSPLKGKVGDMRREIRKSMGQLTEGAGANKVQLAKIRSVLKSSLDGTYVSPMVDVKDYVSEVPQNVTEADVYQGDQMPSLYIYLVNIFSKAVINQFINECGANPRAADPIGVIFSQIFSDKDYHWRGRTLADIMFAKLRIVCPVLFGIRGNERVPAGRIAMGWKRDGGEFVPEQAHWDRMAGLGAGFGAITLRDFSKTTRATPAPPTLYWTALAGLVNTPVGQVSGTQLVVLKAIIDGHTTRFLQFYGNAAVAVLRVALVEFPNKVAKSPGQEALAVVADRLLKDEGLRFA